MPTITFDGPTESQRGEMVESAARERIANGFTTACPERKRWASAVWHGFAGFISAPVKYLSCTVTQTASEVTDQGTAQWAVSIKFTVNPLNGRLDYQILGISSTLTGGYYTYRGSGVAEIGTPAEAASSCGELAGRLLYISNGGNGNWEGVISPVNPNDYINPTNPGSYYFLDSSSVSEKILEVAHHYADGVLGSGGFLQSYTLKVEFDDPWTPTDAAGVLASVAAAQPSLDSISDGQSTTTAYAGFVAFDPRIRWSSYPASEFNLPGHGIISTSNWYDAPYVDTVYWDADVAAQGIPTIVTTSADAGNDQCSRSSLISVAAVACPIMVKGELRRYFIDPLAKLVATNFDTASSCFTIPTPTTLSDGQWGWEFDITSPIQTTNLAVPQRRELTVGVACS